MKFLLIFCALIPHVYVIIFIRPFTAHKSIFHISSHGRGDVIFVNCVLTLAIPFLFGCNCARPVNLGVLGEEAREKGGGLVVCGVGPGGRRWDFLDKHSAALMRYHLKYHFFHINKHSERWPDVRDGNSDRILKMSLLTSFAFTFYSVEELNRCRLFSVISAECIPFCEVHYCVYINGCRTSVSAEVYILFQMLPMRMFASKLSE